MAVASRSSKLYLERSGLVRTVRTLPAYETGANKAHSVEVESPLPELQALELGDPSPDRGLTEEWPNGS